MQDTINSPSAIGQICKIISPLEDENPNDVYIVTEDPKPFDLDDSIYVSNLRDLQKNQQAPLFTPQHAITKRELEVIAENIHDYVSSWKV